MTKKSKEEQLGKFALLYALDCAFGLNRGLEISLGYYENDNDRVEFKFDNHRCRLIEVNSVDYNKGTVMLTVLAKGVELKDWTVVSMNFVATHFRFDTLRRIVEEAYMCSYACHNDTWGDDVDDFIKTKMADWFDSYDNGRIS